MFGHTLQKEMKWMRSPVIYHDGSLQEISEHIPRFTRTQFSANKYLDVITREPQSETASPISVGVVSKQYQLVQHRSIYDKAVKAINDADIKIDDVSAQMSLTEYGERMALIINLPASMRIDPGDGKEMGLNLCFFNSVEGSSGFRMLLGWFRFVCSNGMVVGSANTDYRKRHNQSLNIDDMNKLLQSGMRYATSEGNQFKQWFHQPLTPERITEWVDGPVVKKWGVNAATRAYHIATQGRDATVIKFTPKAPPSKKPIELGDFVPGSDKPADNMFAASQVLTWLASQRRDIEAQLRWQGDIPDLMHALTK